MDNNLEKIIAKINLLLAKAAGSNSPEEAKTAARIADELIQKYRIEKVLTEDSSVKIKEDPVIEFCLETRGRRTNWHEMLISTLTKHYSSRWFLQFTYPNGRKTTSYVVVGKVSDLEIITFFYELLVEKIERLCKYHCIGKGLGYALSWCEGAVFGVSETLTMMQKTQAKDAENNQQLSQALVVFDNRKKEVDEFCERIGLSKKGSGIRGSGQVNAFAHGREVGKGIKINQGIKK